MVGVILLVLVGGGFIALGLLVWKKQSFNLFHDYHVDKLNEEDIPAFCKEAGIGLIVMGSGIALSGLVMQLTGSMFSFVLLLAGIAAGVVLIGRAVNKYNN